MPTNQNNDNDGLLLILRKSQDEVKKSLQEQCVYL